MILGVYSVGVRENLKAVAKAYQHFKNCFSFEKDTDTLKKELLDKIGDELGEYQVCYDYVWGSDTLNIDGVTANRYPKLGDTVIIDVSVGKNGEWCDVCRTFFVGEPTKEMVNAYNLIEQSLRAGHKALKPNVTAKEVYDAVNGVFEKENKKLIHHAGHRIGCEPLMQPQFLQKNNSTVEKGLYYTIESGLYDGFGIRLENDFLINENGAEDLFENLLPLKIEEYILK